MAANAVAAAPAADAEGRPAQPDPGGLRLAEAPTPLMNEPTAPNRDVRIAQLTETFAKLMNALGEKTEAAAAAKIAAEKAKAAAETAVAETLQRARDRRGALRHRAGAPRPVPR